MTKQLKERIAKEWAMLDPVDPLRGLLSDVIAALAQPERHELQASNFCPRCGKRLIGMAFAAGGIHTCTPPKGGHQ